MTMAVLFLLSLFYGALAELGSLGGIPERCTQVESVSRLAEEITRTDVETLKIKDSFVIQARMSSSNDTTRPTCAIGLALDTVSAPARVLPQGQEEFEWSGSITKTTLLKAEIFQITDNINKDICLPSSNILWWYGKTKFKQCNNEHYGGIVQGGPSYRYPFPSGGMTHDIQKNIVIRCSLHCFKKGKIFSLSRHFTVCSCGTTFGSDDLANLEIKEKCDVSSRSHVFVYEFVLEPKYTPGSIKSSPHELIQNGRLVHSETSFPVRPEMHPYLMVEGSDCSYEERAKESPLNACARGRNGRGVADGRVWELSRGISDYHGDTCKETRVNNEKSSHDTQVSCPDECVPLVKPPQTKYIGCFHPQALLQSISKRFQRSPTVEKDCIKFCSSRQYKFFGIRLHSLCFCVDKFRKVIRLNSPTCGQFAGLGYIIHNSGGNKLEQWFFIVDDMRERWRELYSARLIVCLCVYVFINIIRIH